MVKKRKREYTWYLEPSGNVAHSNEVISKNVNREDALQDALCADGKKRNLWRCSSALAYMLWPRKLLVQKKKNPTLKNTTVGHQEKEKKLMTNSKKGIMGDCETIAFLLHISVLN
jgi:hypothetical protein